MRTRNKRMYPVLMWLGAFTCLAACGPNTPVPTATPVPAGWPSPSLPPRPTATVEPTSVPTSTPRPPTRTSTSTPAPTQIPSPQPTLAPLEGYWVQITTREGLCSDSPRLIGYDAPYHDNPAPYYGGSGATVCYFGYRLISEWPHEQPSPIFGFPFWSTVTVPGLDYVTVKATFSEPYQQPSFVGPGGKCIIDQDGQWQCFTTADDLPFDDIRGYGILWASSVEWFMSADSVASRGRQPEDLFYSIPELVGEAEARPTWMSVPLPFSPEDDVWIGTNGYGVVHVEPSAGRVTRYTSADGLPDDTVRDVQRCGEEQCVWVATAGGIGRWDGHGWKAYTTADGLPSDDVRGISYMRLDYDYGTWAATAGGPAVLMEGWDKWQSFPDLITGLDVSGVMGNKFSTHGQGAVQFIRGSVAQGATMLFTTAEGLPSNQITALAATVNGTLVGTPLGAVEWNGYAWVPITGAAVNDAHGNTVGTEEGLWAWNGSAWEQVNTERILQVAQGGWYATPDQVCRREDDVTTCPTTQDGRALVGVQVLYTDPVEGLTLAIDEEGHQWIYVAEACEMGCFIEPEALAYLSEHALPRRINDLVVTAEKWWYATDEGAYDAWIEDVGYPYEVYGDYSLARGWPIPVRQMSLDATTGVVWIATNQGGFYESESGGWTYVAGLPDRDLTTVLALPGGSAWFGTTDAGVIYFQVEAE